MAPALAGSSPVGRPMMIFKHAIFRVFFYILAKIQPTQGIEWVIFIDDHTQVYDHNIHILVFRFLQLHFAHHNHCNELLSVESVL